MWILLPPCKTLHEIQCNIKENLENIQPSPSNLIIKGSPVTHQFLLILGLYSLSQHALGQQERKHPEQVIVLSQGEHKRSDILIHAVQILPSTWPEFFEEGERTGTQLQADRAEVLAFLLVLSNTEPPCCPAIITHSKIITTCKWPCVNKQLVHRPRAEVSSLRDCV